MNKPLLTACCLLLAVTCYAQQVFFNVPSSEMTKAKHVLLQQQVNITSVVESNTTFTTGVGRQLELGLNMLNVRYPYQDPQSTSWYNASHALVNAQVLLWNDGQSIVTAGSQTGVSCNPDINNRFATYNYINHRLLLAYDRIKLVYGPYFANFTYCGAYDSFGAHAGTDISIIPGKFSLTADWIAGKNEISVFVGGFTIYVMRKYALSVGAQFPSPGTQNPRGIVLEFTHL